VLKASKEVIRNRRHMSDAESTFAAGGNAAAAGGKDGSWENVIKDQVRNGGVSLLLLASLAASVHGTSVRIEKVSGETKANIAETNTKIEQLSGETKASIEKLSGETKASIAETNTKIEKLSGEIRASNVETKMNHQLILAKTNTLLGIMEKREHQS